MKSQVNNLLKQFNIQKTVALTWSVSKLLTVCNLLLLVLENVVWLGTLYLLRQLINLVSKLGLTSTEDEIIRVIVISGIISVIYGCIKGIYGYLTELQALKINHHVDQLLHTHISSLDYENFENPERLDVLKRAQEAGANTPNLVVRSLFDILKQFFMLGSVGFILISIDWLLLPLLILLVIPVLFKRIVFAKRGYNMYFQNTGAERQANYLSSLLTGDTFAKEIRTFSLGRHLLEKYLDIKDDLIKQQLNLSRKRTLSQLTTTALGTAAFFGLTSYIVFGAIKGDTTVGDIAIFLVVFPQCYSIMNSLIGAVGNLFQYNLYVGHIFDLLDLKPAIEGKAPFHTQPVNGDLVLQNVSFCYPGSQNYSLSDISMRIPSGKIIALVGLNGAGKTTLTKLLCKLYEPTSGSILFNKVDIRHYSPKQFREKISVVFQDFVKYNFTVKENIHFGKINNEVSFAKIKEAARYAGAQSFISDLPDGYETRLGKIFDNGQELSLGQWQKIAIARAFYSNSSLIILDEATSALDASAETELFRSFRKRIGTRSALVISHRLSTIKHADFIYVMDNKQITEAGTHEELMILNGKYASLYETSNSEVQY